MNSSSRMLRLTASATLVLVSSSCGLVPAQPLRPELGVRVDGSIVSMLIPGCSTESIQSAHVYDRSEATFGPAVWSATGFVGQADGGVRFDGHDWSVTDGDYSGFPSIDVEVTTD